MTHPLPTSNTYLRGNNPADLFIFSNPAAADLDSRRIPATVDHRLLLLRRSISAGMSPVKVLASKRKATTYSSPDIPRERPSLDFLKKEIAFEKVFPYYDLEKRDECRWTLDYLERNKYMSITTPFADDVYPRVVKLFYQRLRYGSTEDGELFIEFVVDKHHGRITTSDMGKITGLPAVYDETLQHLKPPFVFSDDESLIEYILKDFGFNDTKGAGESMIVSALPERVWLLHRILKENIYPLGHHDDKKINLLLALYSAHEGHFYSIPHLLMTGITEISEEIKNKALSGNAAPLPYGFLISAILRHTEYFVDPNEPVMEMETLYPLKIWILTYNRLLNAKEGNFEDNDKTPIGNPTIDTTTPRASKVPPMDIESRLLKLEEKQNDLLRWQKETHHLLRVLARARLGDGFEQLVRLDKEAYPTGFDSNDDREDEEETDSDWE